MFTNGGHCDIMTTPNNLNIHSYRFFSRYGISIAFFAIQLSKLVLVKTLLLLDCIENLCYEEIVWRQLEFAFFGALTLVGALFYFLEEKKMHKEKCNYCGKEIDADWQLLKFHLFYHW